MNRLTHSILRALPRFSSGPLRNSSLLPKARYGGRHTVAMLLGDGIGPEMMSHVKEVLFHAGCPIDFEEVALDRTSGVDIMHQALLAVQRNGVALKGNMNTAEGTISKNLYLRNELGLYAYVTRCQNFKGITTRHEAIDIVIVRENTEGEYAQLEHESVPGVVESLKIMTEEKCDQIARFAFEFAVHNGRKKVTAVHKANIMKMGDGLFLQCCENVAKEYPNIEFEGMIVDNCSMQLVSKPQQFDVLVTPNLYGNIVGNICAALVGGSGLMPGMNVGNDYALFETGTRNSGQSLIGKNMGNPVAMLLAATEMLTHVGLPIYSQLIRSSIYDVVAAGGIRTPDIGGTNSTSEVIDAILSDIRNKIN